MTSGVDKKYILRVTAGPDYDVSNHVVVSINDPTPLKITHPLMDIELNVRIKNYEGLPHGCPKSSPYFETEPHSSNRDRYSICFKFTPRAPAESTKHSEKPDAASNEKHAGEELAGTSGSKSNTRPNGISAADLQFGNDFGYAIRDLLPPGFNKALSIVKWWIDPGLDGDAYADVPHLYGPLLSSMNTVFVGPATCDPARGGLWVTEGADEKSGGTEWRHKVHQADNASPVPDTSKDRMKWALRNDSKAAWVWEYGRTYSVDFFNPYLDFAEFELKLPGFSLPLLRYLQTNSVEKQRRTQHVRYVLRNKSTESPYMVIVFTMILVEDVNPDGSLKPAAEEEIATSGVSHAQKSGETSKSEPAESKKAAAPPPVNSNSNDDDDDVD